MAHLSLILFGSPIINIDGTPLNNRVDKASALVVLLAIQGPSLARETLIANLWTISDLSKARAALRTAIWRLKESRLSPWLVVGSDFITLDTNRVDWIDINEFQTNLAQSRSHPHPAESVCPQCLPLLRRSVDLYRGDFMAGYAPRGAVGFDEWRLQMDQSLRMEYLSALERLSNGYFQQSQFKEAAEIARRWVAFDPYNESAHTLLLRSYAQDDQRANALSHYRAYKRLVETKLGISPSDEITALYKQVRNGKKLPRVSLEPSQYPQGLVRPSVNLPTQSTHFIGREPELSQLANLLAQPEHRLLTLVGPGGVGKTRLAIQFLSQFQPVPPDGICFVPLAAHQDPVTLYKPIAEALLLEFNNPGNQAAQLINFLVPKRMLLLLDNFEQLLDARSFLIDLLDAAPGVRILLTSRQRLAVDMEISFEVQGLPYPQHPQDPDFEHYSAIQLFIRNAQRVFSGFGLRQEDKPYLIQICALVDGLPLGIELASAWVRALSCAELASSIKKNFELLQTSSLDVPPRHRSLHAAFDHSWKLLSEEDRRTLAKLSIFHTGFSPQAAEQVANANPLMLASYVDKSMLTRQSAHRYLMPDTLRVYVLRYLKNNPLDYERLLNAHCDYYLHYLSEMFYLIASETGASVLKKLWLDVDNIRHALFRAIDLQNWPLLLQSINPIMLIFEVQGRFREGYEYANAIMHRISAHIETEYPDIYYAFLGWVGSFNFRAGSTIEGLEKMNARVEYARQHGDIMNTFLTLTMLADAHRRLGELSTALGEINQSLDLMESLPASNDNMFLGIYGHALAILASIQADLGQIQAAHQTIERCQAVLARSKTRYNRIRLLDAQSRLVTYERKYTEAIKLRLEALAIAEDFNDRRNIVGIMNNLGASYIHLGDHQNAWNYLSQANQLCDEIGNRLVSAALNKNLGYLIMNFKHDPAAALPYYEKSLSCYREIVDTRSIFSTLCDISRAYLMVGKISTAHACMIEALHLGIKLEETQLILHPLTVIARMLSQLNCPERAAQLCHLVLSHSKTTEGHRQEAHSLLSELQVNFSPELTADPSAIEPTLPDFPSLLDELNQLPLPN